MSDSTMASIAETQHSDTAASQTGWFRELKSSLKDIAFWRTLVIINGFLPAAFLLCDGFFGNLGANAVNNALHITGLLSLVFLYLSLIITPLRRIFGWGKLIAFRRALGLFGFLYAVVHLLIYVVFDRALDLSSTIEEILSRRYLQIGFIALVLMVPLAVTSTNGMIRRMGAKRWKLLHKLTYVVVILGVAHFYLLVKSDVRQPIAFALVLTPLLGFRLADHYRDLRIAAKEVASRPKQTPVPAKPKFWKGQMRVARVFQETRNVKTFRFQTIDDSELPFRHRPGQYLNIQLPVDGKADGKPVGKALRRSYTISSSPERSSYCEISVKREDQGAGSRYLHDHVSEGDVIDIAAPAGQFVFDNVLHDGVTLIAGGVGITPMMSTARSLTDRSWPGEIYFLFAARSEEDLIFYQELAILAARFSNFHLFVTISNPPENHTWGGSIGRLNEDKLVEFVPGITDHPALVCGPQGMMDATCELLRKIGVPEEYVMTEAFVSPTTNSEEADALIDDGLADSSVSEAEITFASSGVVTTASSDINVLEAAEAAGVDVPFECRSGICGQCKVKCLEGHVHMPSQDALTASEKSKGYILACQAVPRSRELRIEA